MSTLNDISHLKKSLEVKLKISLYKKMYALKTLLYYINIWYYHC